MDIFTLRNLRLHNYSEYALRFLHFTTHYVEGLVQQAFDSQELLPEPMVQLNPVFAPVASVPYLVKDNQLHPCAQGSFGWTRRGLTPVNVTTSTDIESRPST